MDLNELQLRNYSATVRRGLITPQTTISEFTAKLFEECNEFYDATKFGLLDGLELADIIIVCLSTAKHFDIDIQRMLEQKTIINETRE